MNVTSNTSQRIRVHVKNSAVVFLGKCILGNSGMLKSSTSSFSSLTCKFALLQGKLRSETFFEDDKLQDHR